MNQTKPPAQPSSKSMRTPKPAKMSADEKKIYQKLRRTFFMRMPVAEGHLVMNSQGDPVGIYPTPEAADAKMRRTLRAIRYSLGVGDRAPSGWPSSR